MLFLTTHLKKTEMLSQKPSPRSRRNSINVLAVGLLAENAIRQMIVRPHFYAVSVQHETSRHCFSFRLRHFHPWPFRWQRSLLLLRSSRTSAAQNFSSCYIDTLPHPRPCKVGRAV